MFTVAEASSSRQEHPRESIIYAIIASVPDPAMAPEISDLSHVHMLQYSFQDRSTPASSALPRMLRLISECVCRCTTSDHEMRITVTLTV